MTPTGAFAGAIDRHPCIPVNHRLQHDYAVAQEKEIPAESVARSLPTGTGSYQAPIFTDKVPRLFHCCSCARLASLAARTEAADSRQGHPRRNSSTGSSRVESAGQIDESAAAGVIWGGARWEDRDILRGEHGG